MKHIISMLMENESGALSRVAGLFSARGYNIHALTVAPTEDESLSRLTLVTSGTQQQIEQVVKHLNRLIDVVKIVDLTESSHVERELMLIKLAATGSNREEFLRLTEIFRGQVVDVSTTTFTIQMVGEGQKLDAFIAAIDPMFILETVRSGTMGIMRGEKSLQLN